MAKKSLLFMPRIVFPALVIILYNGMVAKAALLLQAVPTKTQRIPTDYKRNHNIPIDIYARSSSSFGINLSVNVGEDENGIGHSVQSSSSSSVTIIAPRQSTLATPEHPYPSPLHSIHVQPLLSSAEASTCLTLAREHASKTGRWDNLDTDRHVTYSTVDFAVEDCENLTSYLEEIDFHSRILGKLSKEYGVDLDDMSYLDFFCANYEAKKANENRIGENTERRKTLDRLDQHRDGSLLSFTVLLSPPDEFTGGGTIFDCLRDVVPETDEARVLFAPNGVIRPQESGDAVLHSGKLLHGGDVVMSGQRTILVGFVDVAEWCLRPGELAKACKEFGRMDVALYKVRRQRKMTENGLKQGWTIRNQRWLPNAKSGGTGGARGRSHIQGYVPAFESVSRRGDVEYQRLKKLQVEDLLLRSILLPKDERNVEESFFGGDVTVLETT